VVALEVINGITLLTAGNKKASDFHLKAFD
jgi:hypothetical protein